MTHFSIHAVKATTRYMLRLIYKWLFAFMVMYASSASAAVVHGRITDNNNLPLPFATIFVKGSTLATTSNNDGNYQLTLEPGNHTIVFKYIGFAPYEKKIEIVNQSIELNVQLQPEQYNLSTVEVKAGGRDPAYEIMNEVISRRNFYRTQANEFVCDAYTKGLQRMVKYPQSVLGQKVTLDNVIDTATKIFYLSEAISQLNYKAPEKVKEIMKSSKVSGRSNSFSFNRAGQMIFNIYENLIPYEGLNPRGFVSPVAQNAMFYYSYKLIGSYFENDALIYKITFTPRRKNDPVFRGEIFIKDKDYRVHSFDMYLIKEAQMQVLDTLRIKQVLAPVTDSIWLPLTCNFSFYFKFFGFEGDGVYHAVFSNYNLTPGFAKNFFNGAAVKVEEGANKKDSTYWTQQRPVPLSAIEQNDYSKRDSLESIKDTKAYKDSLDKRDNKLKPLKLIYSGYTYTNRWKKMKWNVEGLLYHIQFNPVEGINVGTGFNWIKRLKGQRNIRLESNVRYAFAAREFLGDIKLAAFLNPRKSITVELKAGHEYEQFNEARPVSVLAATSYALFYQVNYLKLFQKDFLQARFLVEPINGIMFFTKSELALRSELFNNTNYSWGKNDLGRYTSNVPLQPNRRSRYFTPHMVWQNEVIMRLRFKQTYYSDPENFYHLDHKGPTIFFILKNSLGLTDSMANFSMIKLRIEDNLKLGMIGKVNWSVEAARIFDKHSSYFIDRFHFSGSRTLLTNFALQNFQMLDYYSHSTYSPYVQTHLSYNMGGLLFNKIPGLRKAMLREVIALHALHIKHRSPYYEVNFGIEKLGLLQMAYCIGFEKNKITAQGFRFGIYLNGNN